MVKILKSWFGRLDTESRFRLADFTLEDPSSLEKTPAPSLFDDATKSLSIVIPAYNEEDRLPSTLEETLAYLSRRRDKQGPHFTYEVIIVDDGSHDKTAHVAFTYVRKHGFDAVRVLRLPANRGKGFAVKAGMLCSRGTNLLLMDADGATRVSEVEKLEAKMKELLLLNSNTSTSSITSSGGKTNGATTTAFATPSPLGFVLGSRAHLQESAMAKRTAVRNILMHGFHALVTLVVGNKIRDTQCGFKLLTRPAARFVFPNQRLQRWAFDVELVYVAQSLKVPMSEVQVTWTEIPGSKVRMTSIIHIAFELATIAVGYKTGMWRAEGPQELHSLVEKKKRS
jgi:dolichyl-phosphate beta-glucosyltransferase